MTDALSVTSMGQASTALGTAASQHLTAVAGGHSLAEAVLLGALALLGLIGTEHCMTPPFCKIRRQSKAAAHTRRRAGDLSPAAAVDRLDAAKRHGKHYTDFPAPCQQKSAFSTKEPHSAAGRRFWARNSVISPTK